MKRRQAVKVAKRLLYGDQCKMGWARYRGSTFTRAGRRLAKSRQAWWILGRFHCHSQEGRSFLVPKWLERVDHFNWVMVEDSAGRRWERQKLVWNRERNRLVPLWGSP